MNCPGHMLLFGSRLRSYRELPLRFAESSTLHRDELAGTLHGLLRVSTSRRTTRTSSAAEEQIQDEIAGWSTTRATSTTCSGSTPRAELSTRPDNKLGTDEQWDRTEAALEQALKRHELRVRDRRGRGRVLRPEDRPAHDGRARPLVADGHDPARLADAVRFGLTYVGADNAEHHPYVIHRALLGSLERFIGILIEHYAGAFPFWLAPVQVRILPVGEAHREAAEALREEARRATASRSTTRTRRSASGSATPSSRRSRT